MNYICIKELRKMSELGFVGLKDYRMMIGSGFIGLRDQDEKRREGAKTPNGTINKDAATKWLGCCYSNVCYKDATTTWFFFSSVVATSF